MPVSVPQSILAGVGRDDIWTSYYEHSGLGRPVSSASDNTFMPFATSLRSLQRDIFFNKVARGDE
jgi:hypothetical protein